MELPNAIGMWLLPLSEQAGSVSKALSWSVICLAERIGGLMQGASCWRCWRVSMDQSINKHGVNSQLTDMLSMRIHLFANMINSCFASITYLLISNMPCRRNTSTLFKIELWSEFITNVIHHSWVQVRYRLILNIAYNRFFGLWLWYFLKHCTYYELQIPA